MGDSSASITGGQLLFCRWDHSIWNYHSFLYSFFPHYYYNPGTRTEQLRIELTTATEKYIRSFSKDIYIESNTGGNTYKDIPVFPIYKIQFFHIILIYLTSHNWNISVGCFKQEKILTQDSTDGKAEGRIAEPVPIRKCFPLEPGMELPTPTTTLLSEGIKAHQQIPPCVALLCKR